jgi:Tol biopolymer transport system component
VVLEAAYYPRYSPTGHLIYVQGGRVLAAPFDPDTLTVTGPSAAVLDGVWTSSWVGYGDFAFSNTGTLVYISGGPDPTRASVVSVDRNGLATPLLAARRPYRLPRLSPDNQQLMLVIGDEQVDIWSYDLERSTPPNRETLSPSWDAYPLWQPGTEWITFSSTREGLATTFRKHLRTEEVERLVLSDHPNYPGSWSSDGKLLAFWEENDDTGLDIWVHSVETGSRNEFLRTPYNESAPVFSPDGRFIAYHSNEAGQQLEVYVRPYPESNPRHRISTDGGRTPRWGPDGRELFYIVDGKLMVVEIAAAAEFSAGPPRQLFAGPYGESYDVASDGSFFVMLREWAAGDPPLRLVYTPNWFVDLEDRFASGR